MSSKIFYFSGTGNSLAVARELNDSLSDKGSIIPLSIFRDKESVLVDTDLLGFVFPVYFINIPDIVKAFIKKLTFKTNPYIFAIVTCNGTPGTSLIELNKCLACFHWCPKKSISAGKMLNKRDQYHHPEISLNDMELKNKL